MGQMAGRELQEESNIVLQQIQAVERRPE